jgi:transcriptional regulator with XRE-family HTH domain
MYALVVPETDFSHRAGTALRAAAYYRGMSTDDLAIAAGVSVESIRRWMRGERAPGIDDAALLALALNAPSDLFLRPPETRERALAMMAAWDALRDA